MSEFSESYHLRAERQEDGVSLLRRAGLSGYVFPAANGWVTLVAEGEQFGPNESLIQANSGVLLQHEFAEDHGWGVTLFVASSMVQRYSCTWEDDDLLVEGGLDVEQFDEIASTALSGLDPVERQRIFSPKDAMETIETRPAEAFARAVGLAYFEWLSFDYLALDEDRGYPLPDGVVKVIPGRGGNEA